jgi:HYR domain/Putative Ig domain/Galactose oxidase, central domain
LLGFAALIGRHDVVPRGGHWNVRFNNMKTLILTGQAALIAASFLFCPDLVQATTEVGPDYVVFKEIKSNQTDVGTIALASNPYRIEAFVQATSNGSITGATMSLPAGSSATSPQTLALQTNPQNDGTYGFQQNFADQATLNSNYADGTYNLQITGASSATYNASLSVTGDVYPSLTPTITNTNWVNGNLVVDPTASFTVTWGAFSGSTASDRIGVGVGRVQDSTVSFQVLPASTTSVTFPANYFQPAQGYALHVVFLKATTTDTTDIPGSTGRGGFGRETKFSIQTTGASETWNATGTLNTARYRHTATLLPNGMVLVAGGLNSSNNSLASAELYDPVSGSWTTTGQLNIARTNHTATLLPNGTVLVAGGFSSINNGLASAELYDPAIGSWTLTGNLNTARFDHTATLLPDGKVLVAGVFSTVNAELYDPASGTWTATGSLNTEREGHTATLLSNGKVLVAAGFSGGTSPLASAELYDPAIGSWALTGNLNTARFDHTATLLSSGKVLVAAGQDTSGNDFASVEVYDPASGIWTATGSLNTARFFHTATLLSDDRVLVAGGFNSGGTAELYDPASGIWTATGSLITARAEHTATLLPNGEVLVAGGVDSNNNAIASAELFIYDTSSPIITGGNLSASATVGQQFVYQIVATNSPASYDASGLPSGLSIDTSSGIIYGIPSVFGNFSITISASNSFGTGSGNLALVVQPVPSGPQIISSTSATGRTGQPFRFQVLTSGASPAAQLSASSLPPGLSFDPPTGLILGTPSSDGNFPVTLTLTDGSASASAVLQLTFTSDPAVPVITSSDSATLVSGQFFSYTFVADANATFSYIGIDGVKNGALPPGLGFDGIATISGTYSGGSGGNNGIVRANGALPFGGKGTVRRNTITIRPPRICTIQLIATSDKGASTDPLNFFAGPTTLTASQPPDITAEATGPGGATVNFASPTVTDGSGNNLAVTCNPSSGSTFPVGQTTVACTSAADSSGAYGIVTFNVTVQDTTPPVITAMPTSITVAKQKAAKGRPQGAIVNFASQLAATDIVDGTFIPSSTPASGSFFPLGSTTVTVTATDHAGNMSASKTFTVTVASKAPKKKTATVLVSVSPPSINGGQSATFTISLSAAKPSQPITINYTMGGPAIIGTDYTLADEWGTNLGQSGSITIPSGASSAAVTLNSIANSLSIPSVTATMTIGGGSGYKLGKTSRSAAVTINNVP